MNKSFLALSTTGLLIAQATPAFALRPLPWAQGQYRCVDVELPIGAQNGAYLRVKPISSYIVTEVVWRNRFNSQSGGFSINNKKVFRSTALTLVPNVVQIPNIVPGVAAEGIDPTPPQLPPPSESVELLFGEAQGFNFFNGDVERINWTPVFNPITAQFSATEQSFNDGVGLVIRGFCGANQVQPKEEPGDPDCSYGTKIDPNNPNQCTTV